MTENAPPNKRGSDDKSARQFVPVRIAILVVSDTRTLETDISGKLAETLLAAVGHELVSRQVVTDNRDKLSAALSALLDDPTIDVVVTSGGTGVTPRDITPEVVAPFVTKEIPGFGELFRQISFEEIGTSTIQSRAMAGLCDKTFVFALPGSSGAVRTAVTKILLTQLDFRHRPCNFVELMPRIRSERED